MIGLARGSFRLFHFLCFFVLNNFLAVSAKFLKFYLFRRINFVTRCDIISVFANSTD